MASEAEAEALIVRLTADIGELKDGMRDAVDATKDAASDLKDSAQGIADTFKSAAGAAVEAFAALGGKEWLKEAFDAFSEAERVDLKLAATLRANERDVAATKAEYEEFANEIQNMTTMGDEAVKTLLKQAETFELTGDSAKRAVKDAIGLGEAADASADAMLRITAAMEQGDTKRAMMFSRSVKQLRGVKDAAVFTARYQKLVAAGFEAAQEAAGTASGRITQLEEAYGNLLEQFGEIVADGIKPVVEWIKEAVEVLQGMSKEGKTAVVVILGVTVAVVSLSAAVTALGIVANLASGGTLALVGIIVLAGVALAAWIISTGGVKEAWVQVTAAGKEFWAWFRPIWNQYINLAKEAGRVTVLIVSSVWKLIKALGLTNGLLFRMFGNWKDLRDAIVLALITAEFELQRFSQRFEAAVLLWEFAVETFKQVFIQAFQGMMQFGIRAVGWIGSAFDMLKKGQIGDVLDLVKNLPNQLNIEIEAAFKNAALSDKQKDLMKQMKDVAEKMGEQFPAFFMKRWKEIFADMPNAEKAMKDGIGGGKGSGIGGGKATPKIEHVARRSAEALSRAGAYLERNRPAARGGPLDNAGKQLNVAQQQRDLLKRIADNTEDQFEFEEVGL